MLKHHEIGSKGTCHPQILSNLEKQYQNKKVYSSSGEKSMTLATTQPQTAPLFVFKHKRCAQKMSAQFEVCH